VTSDSLRAYCLSKNEVTEETPFGPDVLVFKVAGKMFALTGIDDHPTTVNLKCDPERSIDLRERYEAVRPGYHMNKTHWNTVVLDGSIADSELRELIDHSYTLIVQSLKKADRERLQS
jgi:predicted DNA-binding protein (MmcQ/YjbR family)